ncbi:hypothetical protein [Frondihabitans australicus]|uniref:RlpA-like protein double-psi beta-barrel domain-containing protein n=1 Tax=Frondihabitans australicus TaxID=386892 RepID=A0A495ILM1_9MICO|nr:hypothetical protein [Frondihabitans australicus]RKR76630.1 hypothetical protein C8E83_3807 [Frondihabitans australicus]
MALAGVGIAAAAIIAVVVVSAHATPEFDACPAVGYVTTVDVRIAGDAADVHDVRLCTTGGCSAPAAEAAWATPETGASAPATTPADDGSTSSIPEKPTGPELPAPVPPTGAARVEAPSLAFVNTEIPRTWEFELPTGNPRRVSAAAYGADGRALAGRVFDLRWHRNSPGDRCDLSESTGAVTLHVGS